MSRVEGAFAGQTETSSEVKDLPPDLRSEVEPPHRSGGGEVPVRGRAGIHEKNPLQLTDKGGVGVAENDDRHAVEGAAHPLHYGCNGTCSVDETDAVSPRPHDFLGGKEAPHFGRVHVSRHRLDGCYGGEFFDDCRTHQVSGVKDEIDPLEGGEDVIWNARSCRRNMGVRYDPQQHVL